MAEMDILNIYEYVVSKKPKVVIVDSIQTLYNSSMDSISGTPTQIRECTLKIVIIVAQIVTGKKRLIEIKGHSQK